MACPDNVFDANRTPTGNDDPCNTSGEGVFESGSYWLYDPTQPGADTAIDGSCFRLFQRIGDTCTVAEWLEISIPNTINEIIPPVDGIDCCPVGSVWCVPAGTGGSTVDQLWLSVGEACGGDCASWVKICGHTFVSASYQSTYGPVPANTFTNYEYGTEITDTLGEYDQVAGTFTAATAKTITITAGFQVNFPNFLPTLAVGAQSVMDTVIVVLLNGLVIQSIALDSMFIPEFDAAVSGPRWTPNARGTVVLDLVAGDVISFQFFHDNFADPMSLTPGDNLWNELAITERTC